MQVTHTVLQHLFAVPNDKVRTDKQQHPLTELKLKHSIKGLTANTIAHFLSEIRNTGSSVILDALCHRRQRCWVYPENSEAMR